MRTRTLLVAVAAGLCVGVMTSSTAAAPVYTAWSAPVNLGPAVNSAASETGPAFSADGLTLYFSSDQPAGGLGLRDIWFSERATTSSPWGAPVHLPPPINTASDDFVPSFSPDGHWMFFASTRPGGFGGPDLYQSYRADVHDNLGWQAPTNLGAGVNTAAAENGNGYFDNEGHGQIYFGSDRLGPAGNSLFYLSNRQADGTWGAASLVPELGAGNRPSVRPDGLEIFIYSTRAGGIGGVDLWSATRATIDAPWSTPVNLGATVNSTVSDQHPYISADGRTLVFYSNRAGGSGGNDLWTTTRAAQLTVTASNQSRLFGQPNPPLTYTVSGFVGGDTSAVVTGTAACTTTATASSPGGTYPITCTAGTLSASGYVFATFVPGTLSVTYTTPCLTGLRTGPLNVSAGESICIGAGGHQTGPVTVQPGGSLDIEGGRITGPLTSTGAKSIRICGANLTGLLTVRGSTGPVIVGGATPNGPCAPSMVVGPVTVTANTAGVQVMGATVFGLVRVTSNSGGTTVAGNTIHGPLTVTGNSGAVIDAPNTVNGPSTLQ
jgi:hypothetical protein